MQLDEVRAQIDEIDDQLIKLLTRRMDCSLKVAKIKAAEGMEIYHPKREELIFNKVRQKGGEYGEYLVELYRLLMECSRALQHQSPPCSNPLVATINNAAESLNIIGDVACYGQTGAFTHLALKKAFGKNDANPVFCPTFEKVFEAVKSGKTKFGIVPVENSSAGSVNEVYDLILKYKLFIVGACSMPVSHNLLGLKGAKISDIKAVYSHPQALSQCKTFLEENSLEGRVFSNTAAAAKQVADINDLTIGAIGSTLCADENNLDIIAPNIQSFENNQTRFIVISKHPVIPKDSNKISLVFSLSHTPGSLQKILTRFSLHGLNLTKLESRAGKNGDFETQFYLDFDGNVAQVKTLSLLCSLLAELNDFSFLGNYKEIKL